MRALLPIALLAASLLFGTARAQTADQVDTLRAEAERAFLDNKFAEALTKQRSVVGSTEGLERTASRKPGRATGEALGKLAYFALFARSYPEALEASRRAHALSPDDAHAWMFLGREQEARKLHLAHRKKRMASNVLWEDDIEDDFVKLTEAGIGHQAMPRLLQALGVKKPRGAFERNALHAE